MAQAEREGVMNEYYAAPDHNSTLRLVPLEEAVEKPPAWLASIIYFIMSCMNGHRSSTHATEDMIISKHRTPVVKERVNELMADRLQPLIDKYYASQYAYTINYAGVPAFIADAAQSGSLLSAATSATSSVSSPSSSPLFDYTTEPAGGEDRTLEIKIDDMHMMRFQGERRKKKKSNKKDSKDRIDGTGMRTDKGLLTLYIALDSLATYSGGAIVLGECAYVFSV